MAESKEELKNLLMKVKEEIEKAGLNLNIQENKDLVPNIWPHYFMANSWGNNRISDFIVLGSKVTADDYYSPDIKRHLLLGRKAMTNLDSIIKSRDIALMTKSI